MVEERSLEEQEEAARAAAEAAVEAEKAAAAAARAAVEAEEAVNLAGMCHPWYCCTVAWAGEHPACHSVYCMVYSLPFTKACVYNTPQLKS